jgi:3-oxoacyl-[acyl-carrier-protein] synthase III
VSQPPAAVLIGLGSAVPPRVVTNDDLAQVLDTSDEWIRTRTGIGARHVIEPGMCTGTLAVEAGEKALKSACVAEVDAVVVATTTPDRPLPSTAPEVATKLGQGRIAAFDVNGVCAGFVCALAVGAGLISTGTAARVLVIGADTMSTRVDPTDRGNRAIFGDGAGAVVLRAGTADEPGALGPFDLGSDGELSELAVVPDGGSRQRAANPATGADYLLLQGKQIFVNAVQRMASSSRQIMRQVGWSADDIDRFIGHQANARILSALAEELGLAPEKVFCNIENVGNTAAASIPLALADAATQGVLRAGDRVLVSSFGGGLTWGSTALRWPELTVA